MFLLSFGNPLSIAGLTASEGGAITSLCFEHYFFG
jgi:hypothetical protein